MTDNHASVIEVIREMCRDRLVVGTWGNVSVRSQEDCCFITPSGMSYDILTVSDLVQINLNTGMATGRWKPSSEWRLHCEIYRGRPDCNAIVHTHSTYATAFAVARLPIPPVVEDMIQVVGGKVDVAEYALPGTVELAQNVLHALGDKTAVLMAAHGLVGVGNALHEALKVCQIVEKAAQIALLARSLGPVQEIDEDDILAMRTFYLTSYGPEKNGEE